MKKSVKIIISVLLFALVGTGMFTYSQIAAKASEYRELIEAGEKAVSNGNSEEALKYYEKAIQLVPRKTAAYEKAADTYCEQWKYEEAEKVLETAKRAVKKSEKKRISKKIEELGVSKKAGYEKIYLEFVKKEFIRQKGLASLDKISFQIPSIVDAGSIFSTENMVKENKGVISRYIVDMNKDNVPEMILSYADVLPNLNDQNTGQLVVEIYTIRDGQVVKVEFDENDELPNDMHYEFFYNKCQGNIHVFLNEYEGIVYLNILYALENSIGTLNYDVRIDTYCVGRGGYLSWMMGLSMSDGQYDGYQGLATEIQKSYEILYPLGDWFVDSFESSLGESGTEVFAPYDFDLSEKDSTLTEITRIQASRENGMQSFKYYDYSDLREHIGLSKQSKKVLEKQIQKIGLADIQDFWITYQGDEMFGSADERNMGLLSALEYDCNFDGKDELLVFYLKQELHQEDDWSCSEQNLYIDLYAEKKGKLKLVKTVDVLKPVVPWSSQFCGSDIMSVGIKQYEDRTYLYLERESGSEGPYQLAKYVYDLTDCENIQKTVYYKIYDAGRSCLTGELMIPASINGGSGGNHEFLAKVGQNETEIYFEVDGENGEPLVVAEESKCDTMEKAEAAVEEELQKIGLDETGKATDFLKILSWKFYYYVDNHGAMVVIQDDTSLRSYFQSEEVEETKPEKNESPIEETPTDIEVTYSELAGTWSVDVEKTNNANSHSLRDEYGSAIQYGNGLEMTSDKQFSYYIASGYGGKGTYEQLGNQIVANIEPYEYTDCTEFKLFIEKERDGKICLKMEHFGYTLYWEKN